MMLIYALTIIFVGSIVPALCSLRGNQVEKYFNICQRNDPKIEDCIRKSIDSLRPRLIKGIEEIGIPPCEPLKISEIKLVEDTGAIAVYSNYRDIEIRGLSDFQIRDLKIDLDKNFMQVKVWFPNLELAANYSISGKIMMMPLQGEGLCSGNFTDIDVTSFLKTSRKTINENEHLHVDDIGVNFTIGGTTVNLENLFNGDPELGPAVNKFLNENWQSIIAEVRPTLERKMASMVKMIAAKLFDHFTYDELLPP